MSAASNLRLIVTKAALWLFVGAGMAVAAARFVAGLGVTTALSDLTPWGLWIGFDVVSGVALAAGGFVLAATVHVFHLKRYHAVLRPAVLTAFLGYVAVVVGLLADLGRPWNIWRPTVFWQPHSALFEVAWCVMLYLTVLALEFAPVVFEGLAWSKAFRFMQRLTLPLVVIGIGLSTLHQSSLGTLFVLVPNRLHPLWYSPILPLLFLISAVGLGLGMVTAESLISAWLFHREPEWPIVRGLTRAAAFVLGLYLVVRLGDLAWRGQLHFALEGSWNVALFGAELLVSTVVPILLFTLPSARGRRGALATGAFFVVGGFVLQRASVAGIGQLFATGSSYTPALTELLVSLGIVAAMALVFLFFVEHLRVWEEPPAHADHFRAALVESASAVRVRAPWLGGAQREALAWIVGLLVGAITVQGEITRRSTPRPEPITRPRTVVVLRAERHPGPGHVLRLAAALPAGTSGRGEPEDALLLDGGRSGWYVVFEHARHQQRLGGLASCATCHHRNLPLDRATSCSACHRDMYASTDTFDHAKHVAALGANDSCARCHPDPGRPKTRAASTPCRDCHARDISPTAAVKDTMHLPAGIAVGYRAALHGLCIDCHREEDTKHNASAPYLSRCPNCHRQKTPHGDELRLREGWSMASVAVP
jgi:Ni/Fe-hydrogenase subunit HybB-like protein